jgi:putative nucleotidyltransferase with HDIG domain
MATRNGDAQERALQPFWQKYLYGLVLGVILVAITTLVFPLSSLITPLATPKVGDMALEDIVAPYTIPIKRTAAELEILRDSALQSVPLVFRYDGEKADSVFREARGFFAGLEAISTRGRAWEDLLLAFPHLDIPVRLQDADSSQRRAAAHAIDSSLHMIYRFGLLRNLTELPLSQSRTAAIVQGESETLVRREHLMETPAAQSIVRRVLGQAVTDSTQLPAFYQLARQWLVPNLLLDLRATERRKEMALSSIPVNKGVILKDEYIVRAGEPIQPRHLQGMQALAESRLSSKGKDGMRQLLIPIAARVLFLLALFAGFGVALCLARPGIFAEPRSLLALSVLYLLQIVLAYLIFFRWEVSGYLLPVAVATMLVTILLSLRVGLSFAVFLALVLGVISGFDFAPVFLVIAAGTVSALAVSNVRKRHQFYKPMLFLALTYLVVIALVESLRFTENALIMERVGYGVLNGILSPIITIGLLPIFETTFRLTTDITLLELADMNHPLLRRLSVAAPGTYHHSIIVANLCEAASEAVSANPLLARVGAYFHDIGKMEKPEYFVENQMGRKNKHEELAPSMSALILAAHVKSGAEMAREARLPDLITDFIEQHHGTTQMSYFYRKAVEQAGHEIPDSDFRYPGPKPKMKETAILMLADSTEAVSRTLEDPRPNRLRSAIHQVITDKFLAGQLSDCPLTLADLSRIEDSFLHLLLGAFHGRIRYPDQQDAETRKKESILG